MTSSNPSSASFAPIAEPSADVAPVADVAPQASNRRGRELLAAAKPFTDEVRWRSWFHFVESFAVFFGLLGAIAYVGPWWAKLPLAVLDGLVAVRLFILYHDFQHNAILRGSKLADAVMWLFGVYVLTPKNVWKQTHNYHHAHTAKIVGSHVGSYLMVTTDIWEKMSPKERLVYKAYRHPLTIFFAYFTVFFYGMCIASFGRNPRKNWDSMFAIVVHVAAAIAIPMFFGWETFLFLWFIPLFVATMTGAYLFYAQHNYPDIHVQPREEWEFSRAAIESSSFMETGPILQWLTGNIGFHHVHHLNPTIPFYRLPEAMSAIPELQTPGKTSLGFSEIVRCFGLKLWDTKTQRMVGYPEA
jgi:omega-6 fatty acid desaturase (delta-12 desaturase)